MSTFGQRLKLLRSKRKLTQKELAPLINTTRDTLANWEIDRAIPDMESIKTIAGFFGVTTDHLLGVDTLRNKVISKFDQMELNDEQKAAAKRIKEMPLTEQQESFLKAVDKFKNLSAEHQEALIKIINSLPSSQK